MGVFDSTLCNLGTTTACGSARHKRCSNSARTGRAIAIETLKMQCEGLALTLLPSRREANFTSHICARAPPTEASFVSMSWTREQSATSKAAFIFIMTHKRIARTLRLFRYKPIAKAHVYQQLVLQLRVDQWLTNSRACTLSALNNSYMRDPMHARILNKTATRGARYQFTNGRVGSVFA